MADKILNEFEARDLLAEKRKEIKSFEDLTAFLQEVKDNYNYDYGVAPRSIAQACLATAWYFADVFGITGFQAGFVMWEFVRDWNFPYNQTGLRIVDFDNMLYPQYEDKFQKTITPDVWTQLQVQAKKNLEERDHVHPAVAAHWQSIVDGVVPFGYVVSDR